MKILIVFAALAAVTFADKRCHGVFIDNRYYNLEIVKEGINNLHDLVISRNDNSVYFTYDDWDRTLSRRVAHFDLYTKKATVIDGIRNATALAVDQFYGKVYVGGMDGLYKINNLRAERLPLHDKVISMHFKDVLYFINGNKEAFKFEDGHATPVSELRGIKIDRLVINDDGNVFFTENQMLYRVQLGTRAINTHEKYNVNALATDAYSRTFICTKDGLYMYNKYKFVFDKMADLRNLKAVTFDKMNDPIYAVNDLLVKLTTSSVGCFED